MQHGLEELQGSLRLCTLSAGTDQGSVRDPVWEEALVQHCLEEPRFPVRSVPYRRALRSVALLILSACQASNVLQLEKSSMHYLN